MKLPFECIACARTDGLTLLENSHTETCIRRRLRCRDCGHVWKQVEIRDDIEERACRKV